LQIGHWMPLDKLPSGGGRVSHQIVRNKKINIEI